MGEGPEPMKDLKPAPMNPNSADQFREAHEAPYEARATASSGKVDKVLQRKVAHPKLVELDKRKSIVQIKVNNQSRSDKKCIACDRLKQLVKLKKLKIKPKCFKAPTRRRSVSRKRKYKPRIKNKKKGSILKRRRDFDDYFTNNMIKHFISETHPRSRRGFRIRGVEIKDNNSQTDSIASTMRSPDTSEPSISSYHSYPSRTDEPLV